MKTLLRNQIYMQKNMLSVYLIHKYNVYLLRMCLHGVYHYRYVFDTLDVNEWLIFVCTFHKSLESSIAKTRRTIFRHKLFSSFKYRVKRERECIRKSKGNRVLAISGINFKRIHINHTINTWKKISFCQILKQLNV